MPHQQSRRQETRCWLPGGEVVFVEEGADCPGISGQQGSGRRRLFWEHEGLITRAPPRPGPTPPPAGPQPGDRPYKPGSGRREGIGQKLPDDRPAYRGGGYGFPHPWPISQEAAGSTGRRRVSQEYALPAPTIWGAVLAGLGLGVGFAIVNKVIKS